MDTRQDNLIKSYLEGNIDIEYFTNEFTIIYGQETDYDALEPVKRRLYSELYTIAARYSPFPEEIEK